MNKKGIFLVVFLLLLGLPIYSLSSNSTGITTKPAAMLTTAAAATSGTLKVIATEDVTVVNGSSADSNLDGMGVLIIGALVMGEALVARAWFKFDLTYLPQELSIQRATINVHVYSQVADDDKPLGIYHSSNDMWDSGVITWNNQPTFSATPSDVIDSPASPDMFIDMTWYAWDITSDVRGTMNQGDMILSEVLKQVDETGVEQTFMALNELETYQFNATYLEIEYTVPTTSGLTVDGIASGPLLDYINNPCPELGWTFSDPDYHDFQKDYDVEIWNNTYYNETMLWQSSHEFVSTIHDSDTVSPNWHPFGLANEFRMQMKYPSTEIPRSGIVDKLYFTSANNADLIAQLENFEISLVMVPSATALSADLTANLEGRTPTIVLARDSYELRLVDNMIEVDVEDTFFVNEYLSLIVQIRLMDNTGNLIPIDRTNTGGPGSAAYAWGTDQYTATTATNVYDRTYDLKIGYLTESVFENPMSSYNGFPFGVTTGTPGRFQLKYNQSYINRAGYLDKMYFRVSTLNGDVVYENFTISLVETPVKGPIDHIDWVSNYGGSTPITVLDESMYTVVNIGNALVIDFANSFYYSNTNDLLIDFQWDSKVSGSANLNYLPGHTSSFRAYDLHWSGSDRLGNDTAGYEMLLDFVNNEDSVPADGCLTLIEYTRYYWRVRTCDSIGMWSDWTTANFKYEVNTELPVLSAPAALPNPVEVNQEVTVSVNATHSLGIYVGYFEYGGSNHSMTASGDTFSFAWTPTSTGVVDYTIYIHSNVNTWASVSGSVNVTAAATTTTGTGTPGDMTMILIIVGAAAVVIVIIVIIMKKKK